MARVSLSVHSGLTSRMSGPGCFGSAGPFTVGDSTRPTGALLTGGGTDALASEAGGDANSAFGYNALFANTTGGVNTAIGTISLGRNTTGEGNVAAGYAALLSNTIGSHNTAVGSGALQQNTTADGNTATGDNALEATTTGEGNTASGYDALGNMSTGGSDKTPPAADCNTTTFVGRLVIQKSLKSIFLWVCSPAGVWAKI